MAPCWRRHSLTSMPSLHMSASETCSAGAWYSCMSLEHQTNPSNPFLKLFDGACVQHLSGSSSGAARKQRRGHWQRGPRTGVACAGTAQVVRCFEDENVIHVAGKVDPVEDIDVINFELALADITQIEKRMQRISKGRAKTKEEVTSNEVPLRLPVSSHACLTEPRIVPADSLLRVSYQGILLPLWLEVRASEEAPLVARPQCHRSVRGIHGFFEFIVNADPCVCADRGGGTDAHCREPGSEHTSAGGAAQ